ncbi:MAG: hypothetical protein AB8B55_08050 [Mariniblastus sp.]
MLPFQIKICGVTSVKDALDVCQSHADAIGLNFYSPSSRFVSDTLAKEIVDAVREFDSSAERQAAKIQPMRIVGVFVNMPLAGIAACAKTVGLDGIQLHGDEVPENLGELRSLLKSADHDDLPSGIIRAIRTKPADAASDNEVARINTEIKLWSDARISSVLLDAAVPGEFGGTGKVVDWHAVPKLDCDIPLVLAGGLRPENVRVAIDLAKVLSVDVASGVEDSPGVKDPAKVKLFSNEAFSKLNQT